MPAPSKTNFTARVGLFLPTSANRFAAIGAAVAAAAVSSAQTRRHYSPVFVEISITIPTRR